MAVTNNDKKLNLFDYTEEQLLKEQVVTYYQMLALEEHASPDQVKKAYRKASLRYHPDKTGRGEDDYVFLAIKAAHDTLMDHQKRQAYDSTVMPFDDEIPPSRAAMMSDPMLLYKDEDFYETFGPVFKRNLRFDARLRPDLPSKNKSGNKQRGGKKTSTKPPELGDDSTPIEEVNAFYEYWIHFDSWRDFSATAAEELNVENEIDNAESRFEKRWIQKEIDKRAKQLKKQEMSRIQTLVERAMEADPRLRRERQAAADRKDRAKLAREAAVQRRKDEEKERQRQKEVEEEEEQQKKLEEKAEREKEKKQLRKARQQLRRMASSSFEALDGDKRPWADSYDMNQELEVLCMNLSLKELTDLNDKLESEQCAHASLVFVKQRVLEKMEQESEREANSSVVHASENVEASKLQSISNPWTKDELSALAKAVRKYPPGWASRWDQITSFVNNLCKQDIPRTKEECIEKYNQVARSSSAKEATEAAAPSTSEAADDGNGWTAEQDQQLQDGLAMYPATMDKNERWTAIAKCVPGKSKKDCVQRFKAIREALKSRK